MWHVTFYIRNRFLAVTKQNLSGSTGGFGRMAAKRINNDTHNMSRRHFCAYLVSIGPVNNFYSYPWGLFDGFYIMGYYCCVPLCNSNSKRKNGISFHGFTKDRQLRIKWLQNIRRDVNSKTNPFRINHHTKVSH